jgi:hypothetical protein
VTNVLGIGGAGGSRRVSWYGPFDIFEGGAGGDVEVVGHRGWNGDAEHPDGATGGDAAARGGDGGTHEPGESCGACRGGAGGSVSAVGGRGGDGQPSCSAPPGPGGSGGAGGYVLAVAGDGGDTSDGTGGDGGSGLRADTGAPGRGADGVPPGACGAVGGAAIAEGHGGSGLTLGAEGTRAEPVFAACATEPPVACDPPPPTGCEHPWSLHWGYDRSYPSDPDFADSGSVVAVESCDAGVCGIWQSSIRRTLTNRLTGEPETTDVQVDALVIPEQYFLQAHCTDEGVLHLGGDGIDETATWTVAHFCGGSLCRCVDPPWTACCPRATGRGFDPGFAPCP